MPDNLTILKDENHQNSVPKQWRNTFTELVEVLKHGNYERLLELKRVRPISEEDVTRIISNVESYGCHLASLPEETWDTSVCQWMRGYWDVLVDLFTIEEGASDLVLSVRVYESEASYMFEIQSVHVP